MRVQVLNVGPGQKLACAAIAAVLLKGVMVVDKEARPVVLEVRGGVPEDLPKLRGMKLELGEVTY